MIVTITAFVLEMGERDEWSWRDFGWYWLISAVVDAVILGLVGLFAWLLVMFIRSL